MPKAYVRNLIGLSTIKYNSITIVDESVVIQAEIRRKTAACPACNKLSTSIHSHYVRKIRDLPVCGKATHIHLTARRFFCRNKLCERNIFSEQTSEFTHYGRLSKRACSMLTKILIEVSSNKGAAISKYISLPVSASSCLQLVHSLHLPDYGQITHLGIDDWALRKGCSYGTAVVNMDTGRIVDLLPGRDGISLAHWLSGQNNIKTVNRDRASSFSSVMTRFDSRIEQIADRFHLMKNLSEHIEAVMYSNSRSINQIVSEEKSYRNRIKPHRNSRLFDVVKTRLAEGHTQTAIAKELGLSRYTVWKYTHSEGFSIGARRTSIFDRHRLLIECELIKATPLSKIHKLIVQAGYKGSRSNFYSHFGDKNRTNPFERTMSMRNLSRHIFSKDISLIINKTERNQVELLYDKLSWIRPLNELCSSFSELLRNGNKDLLDSWLVRAETLNIKRLNRFVSGIRKDYSAVLNAVLYSSSSGVVEGNINRLKSIKRQMYGRASLRLLKRKVILASSG